MIFLNSLTYKYIENHYCAVETAKQSRAMDADTPLLTNNHSSQDEEQKLSTVKRFGNESKRLWKLAGPAIFTAICQYSLGALTQTFAGLVGELDLAAVAVENSVIAGLAFGVMVMIVSLSEILRSFVLCFLLFFCMHGRVPCIYLFVKIAKSESGAGTLLPSQTSREPESGLNSWV